MGEAGPLEPGLDDTVQLDWCCEAHPSPSGFTSRVRTLDPDGYHERDSFCVRAKIVILAANAISSAQILLRSGVGNLHVGRHLSLQPQLPVTAWFPDEDVRFFRGIPQSWAVTEFEELESEEHGWWGFRV